LVHQPLPRAEPTSSIVSKTDWARFWGIFRDNDAIDWKVLPKLKLRSQVGHLLGEIKLLPAILFYLLYVAGIVIFVSGAGGATWQSTVLYGALFGLFCYATFELTSMSMLKDWSWAVIVVDIAWGSFVTAVASTAGLLVAKLGGGKILGRHFGCGTIRIYGFGDFQPCG
jgi:uncharacterized membrane protein